MEGEEGQTGDVVDTVLIFMQYELRKGDLTMFENLNLGNLTPRARQVLILATKEAERDGSGIANDGHVLIGLIHLAQGNTAKILEKKITRDQVRKVLPTLANVTNSLYKVIVAAHREAAKYNHTYIGTEHILIGLIEAGVVSKGILQGVGVNLKELKVEVKKSILPDFRETPRVPQQAKSLNFNMVVTSKKIPEISHLYLNSILRQLIEILDMNPEDFTEGRRLRQHAYLFILWAAEDLNKHISDQFKMTEKGKQEIVRVVLKAKATIKMLLPCLPPEYRSDETYRNLNEILVKVL
jgi:ATP-dependent Clp protease ATP-binding subunit ClpA